MQGQMKYSSVPFWIIWIVLFCHPTSLNSAQQAIERTTSENTNIVSAALLVLGPGDDIVSAFGHAALRMCSPTYGLDFVFTYETDPDADMLTFLEGRAAAKFVAVPTSVFLKDMGKTGRGVMQYDLNLSLQQKQRLWQMLDEEVVLPQKRHFDHEHQCLSMCLELLQATLGKEDRIVWHSPDAAADQRNGTLLRRFTSEAPWTEFVLMTVVGVQYDDYVSENARLSPMMIGLHLSRSVLLNTTTTAQRPTVIKTTRLLPEQRTETRQVITPNILFGLLLLCIICLTLWEWHKKERFLTGIYIDGALLILQALVGLLLFHVYLFSPVFGHHWNWYFVVFNPIPVLVWLFVRRHTWYYRLCALYSLILVIFMCLTPFVGQLDMAHQMITAIFALRAGHRYALGKFVIKHNEVKR